MAGVLWKYLQFAGPGAVRCRVLSPANCPLRQAEFMIYWPYGNVGVPYDTTSAARYLAWDGRDSPRLGLGRYKFLETKYDGYA